MVQYLRELSSKSCLYLVVLHGRSASSFMCEGLSLQMLGMAHAMHHVLSSHSILARYREVDIRNV